MTFTRARGAIKRGELARRSGCNIETIRYYEKIGLLAEPERSDSGHRLYAPDNQARLGFILRGRELGFSIEELRGLLVLVDGGTQTCAEVKERTELHLADIRAKIADLRRIESVLARTASQCSGEEVPDCPVLDALAS
ncbi:MerR family transcriptional regulator [Oceanibacterium hippocampi]|uniref:Mercuric resistance operon regulatory protein n=1 Tax=Oceanibacterium hippocampi TaxID=745714 RepID=A0A1Y5TSJ4_9PROT|nr:helix-turn-helix domain-containing protein [Oceanibacterium hippocampi]SLN71300.1 Mercuric resistance operon regulatory protein [Oceanibacterium hippocampi]